MKRSVVLHKALMGEILSGLIFFYNNHFDNFRVCYNESKL